jgi:ZU5 domain-containing protein
MRRRDDAARLAMRRTITLLSLMAACGGGTTRSATQPDAPLPADAATAAPDAPVAAPDAPAATLIGPEGGTVRSPEGAVLVIPPGALAAPTAVAIAKDTGAPALPAGVTALGPAFALTPHGTTLAVPATLELPLAPGDSPSVSKAEAGPRLWRPILATAQGDEIVAMIDGFSWAQTTVYYPPPITKQPVDQGISVGGTATYTAVTPYDNSDLIAEEWQVSTDQGVTWQSRGFHGPTYTTVSDDSATACSRGNSGTNCRFFRVIVYWSDRVGLASLATVSDPAILIVNGAPDAGVGDASVQDCGAKGFFCNGVLSGGTPSGNFSCVAAHAMYPFPQGTTQTSFQIYAHSPLAGVDDISVYLAFEGAPTPGTPVLETADSAYVHLTGGGLYGALAPDISLSVTSAAKSIVGAANDWCIGGHVKATLKSGASTMVLDADFGPN